MKKALSLLLALAMLCMLFAGCGSSAASTEASAAASESAAASTEEAPAEEPAAEEPAEAAEAAEEPAATAAEEASVAEEADAPAAEKVEVALPLTDGDTISMFLLIPPFITAMVENVDDLSVLNALEERTGIDFDITAGNYLDASSDVNLLIASGDYPDIINGMKNYSAGFEAAMDEDIIIDLSEYIENDMPNFLATINSYGENTIKDLTTASGRMPYFPQVHKDPYIDNFAIGINADVMDELGLETPTTFDEFHDVLAAVYEKTGMQYAFSNEGADGTLLCAMNLPAFGSTGTGVESFRVVDGTVEFGPTCDEMRDYLEMVSQWYSEGLIYKDFLSYEVHDQTNMVTAGELFGIGNVNAQSIGEAAVNDINLEAIPFVTETGSDAIHMKGSGEIVRTQSWSVSTAATDEHIDLICQLVEYIFSDEGTLLFNYGVEGEGYTLDADGNPEWADLVINNESGYNTGAMLYATATPSEYICGIYDDSKFDFSYTEEQIACQDIINNSSDGAWDYPAACSNLMTTDESTEAAAISGDLGTYISETFLSWICGESELNDDTWNTFIESCESMDVDGLTEIYQTVYDRYAA